MFEGLGDTVETHQDADHIILEQRGLRIVRGITGAERELLLKIWVQLWQGALASFRRMKNLHVEIQGEAIIWRMSEIESGS